jgi:hypothetical protein
MLGASAALLATGCAKQFGPIPDAEAAVKAGCAVIRSHFPKAKCANLVARLDGNVWHINTMLPEGYSGGGPNVELSKAEGRVLRFYLTQ